MENFDEYSICGDFHAMVFLQIILNSLLLQLMFPLRLVKSKCVNILFMKISILHLTKFCQLTPFKTAYTITNGSGHSLIYTNFILYVICQYENQESFYLMPTLVEA